MKILFFGYKSFAAQDLYDHLKKKNKNVFYFSRKEKKKKYFFDLTNKINLNYFNKKEKYTIIFFSSFVPQDEKVQNWKHVSKINIDGIIRFINNIKFQLVKIIYISSCSVYGNEKTKLSEKDHLKPITPYSISKLAQENLIRIFCKKNKIKLTIFRLGYVFGDKMKNYRLLKKIKNDIYRKKIIKIYNKNLNLNLIHTLDIKNAILQSLKRNEGTFNLVHRKNITINVFYHSLLKNKEPKYNLLERNKYFSNKFKKNFLNFKFKKLTEALKCL